MLVEVISVAVGVVSITVVVSMCVSVVRGCMRVATILVGSVITIGMRVLKGCHFSWNIVDLVWEIGGVVVCNVIEIMMVRCCIMVVVMTVVWRMVCIMTMSVIQAWVMAVVVLVVTVRHADVIAVACVITMKSMSHWNTVGVLHVLPEEDLGESKSY